MSYQPGYVLKDKYIIQESLGQGSMGEVYRAEHKTLHRQFAIKMMHVHIAEKADALARFRREASAAALLEHPHICQVTDFDSTENGDFYLVMEYLKGETLRDRLNRLGTISLRSVFQIMDDLLCALECAHASGIVHRDVKPENISLISRDDRDDYVKLIDFGIAHADKTVDNSATLTQAGQVYGTAQYLSPEQVMGSAVDFRADLYSCGCMLFEMIEGVPPFEAENYVLLLNKHLVLDPPHLTKKFACSGELDVVIQKLLKKNPEERYGSAREVRATLAEIAKRFDPTINLYLSQNGGTSPTLAPKIDTGSLSGQISSQEAVTRKGLPPITNPIVHPEEVCLSPRNDVGTASNSGNGENAAQSKGKMGMILGIVAGAIVLIVAAVLITVSLVKKDGDAPAAGGAVAAQPQAAPAAQNAPAPAQQANAPERDHPVIDVYDEEVISELDPSGYILSEEQLREFAKAECRVSEDDPMFQDEAIKGAIENCAQGKFEEANKVFYKSKKKYLDSRQFFIMSLISSYAIKRYRDAIRDALQLIIIDPAAVCTPVVREIIYSLYEDDDTYVRLRTGILNLPDQLDATEGLSWLLLMTPCNQHQKRFERLTDSIKVGTRAFEEEYNETWLGAAVNVWDTFDAKGKCSKSKTVDRIVMGELDKACKNAEGKAAESGRCAMCYPLWQKRSAETN